MDIAVNKEAAIKSVIATYTDTKGGDVPVGKSRDQLNDYFTNDIFISMAAAATNDEISEDEFREKLVEHFATK